MPNLESTAERSSRPAGPVVTVDTESIPVRERFGWWNELVGEAVMPVSSRSPYASGFTGRAENVQLPHSSLGTFTYSPMSAWRSSVQIRRQDPEDYFLVLVGDGTSIRLEQGRGIACLEAGEMALFSTSHPLAVEFLDKGRSCQSSQFRLPRTILPLANGRADRLLAEPLSTRSGSGALLVPYLKGLADAVRDCGPAELARIGAVGVDLAASLLAAHLGDADGLPAETRQAALLARINAFIDHNLAEPELRPAAVAAHHHISVRTLHQLFRGEPESVGATIRRRRLERCRADLTDPALHRLPIGEIAARWGFRHPADFSRTFRNAYGVPPSEVRAAGALNAKKARTPC
ncbi:helix-turn-helix domain-containing protein [Streptomyces sp. NBC_01381]|uniref:AraC-like ligand-binding domain-containing protein n=1 Tax=Streptomyces sp. NBC_01381 TaxID=2903845 RepID=UPI00225B1299|nr:helix-turn-helix domain-containing protein [Streptomyces sp. NBC_01381]MCX4666383.1 helix-turn-helix domain-containing protein [Streptomyces sp. NBC_01381]